VNCLTPVRCAPLKIKARIQPKYLFLLIILILTVMSGRSSSQRP